MSKIKFFFVFFILFGLFEFIPKTHSLCDIGRLYVGTAKVDITPTVAIRMSGYSARKEQSKGIHDPIYVRFLVLDVNGYRVAIISCDLIGYNNRVILDVAKERFNIPHVLICSSHTHSGPDLRDSETYARSVEKAMIDGLDEALKNMFPARISAGYRCFPQIGYNRLIMREDGHARATWVGDERITSHNPERIPYVPVDPEVGLLKIEDEKGNPRVILMAYACHSTVNRQNYEISADYPGFATRKVEEAFGNNTICMFIQGGAGDIAPMFKSPHSRKSPDDEVQTDYSRMEKMGSLLAYEAIKAAKSLTPQVNDKIKLKAISDSLKFTGRFNKELKFNVHITTVLINDDIAIASFPGEPFVYFQLDWKKRAEVPYPFFFGYTYSFGGNSPGYVPDIRSAAYGGYGADSSKRAIEVGAGEAIINKHLENLYRLKGIMRDKPGPP